METDSGALTELKNIRKFKMLLGLTLRATRYRCGKCEMSTVEQVILEEHKKELNILIQQMMPQLVLQKSHR